MHLFIFSVHSRTYAHAARSNGVADKGCGTLLQRAVHLYVTQRSEIALLSACPLCYIKRTCLVFLAMWIQVDLLYYYT